MKKASELLESGADIAGGAVGGALGFLAAGPIGAGVAGATGVVLSRTIASAATRLMSKTEQARIGAAASYALDQIARRLSWGDKARSDFFASKANCRSDGEELFEGVLIKARDEYEERKLKYIALFFANLIFDESVSTMTAHRLVKTISQLTYRQFVFLSLVHKERILDVAGLRSHSQHKTAELEALKLEEMELLSGYIGLHGLLWNYSDYDDRLSNLGKILVRLAELDSVPQDEVAHLTSLLATCPEKTSPMHRDEPPPDEPN